MLYDVLLFLENFIYQASNFVAFLNQNFGFGNYSILSFFGFTGLTVFLGTAVVKWFAS